MTAAQRERDGRFGLWLVLACVVHVALFGVLALRSRAERLESGERAREVVDEIELATLEETLAPAESPGEVASAESGQSTASSAKRARAESAVPPSRDTGLDARDSASGAADALTAPAGEGEELAKAEGAAPATAAPLSLDALGVGPSNPFVGSGNSDDALPRREASASEKARAVGRSRFQRSMASEIVRADQSHALGPEGPVLAALENIVRVGDAALRSTARFRFVTDADGRLVRADLIESSSDPKPWRRHGQAVLDALREKKLRVPKTGYGVTFVVRVESRVQMPSGADPGMDINILGIPVQHGEGPRSARMEILNLTPKLNTREERLPSGQTVSVPELNVGNIFSLMGDLSDIGAKPQRMVHAHVEKLSANE